MPKHITEAAGAATALTGTRQRIVLITPGWGSSGYYPDAVLEQAATDRVFPKGTQMHLDHSTPLEDMERPAGSVRTLAAVLTEDAYWDPSVPGLVAESKVFTPWASTLAEMADYIGVSISAAAEFKPGEAEGRRGNVVERLLPDPLNRVDYVTVAGRGGRVAAVLEHRAPAVEATARDVEQQLRELLRTAYGDDGTYVWLEDRDEAGGLAWYTVETPDSTTIWQTGYTVADDDTVTLTGETVQVRRQISYVPVPAPQSPPAAPAGVPQEGTGKTPKESTMPKIEIDEQELTQLRESASRAAALETENATLREGDRRRHVEALVTAAFDVESPRVRAALVNEHLAAEHTDEAITAAAREAAAEVRATLGEGQVHGNGQTTAAESAPKPEARKVTDDDIVNALEGKVA